jgi:hypothetical protein
MPHRKGFRKRGRKTCILLSRPRFLDTLGEDSSLRCGFGLAVVSDLPYFRKLGPKLLARWNLHARRTNFGVFTM